MEFRGSSNFLGIYPVFEYFVAWAIACMVIRVFMIHIVLTASGACLGLLWSDPGSNEPANVDDSIQESIYQIRFHIINKTVHYNSVFSVSRIFVQSRVMSKI